MPYLVPQLQIRSDTCYQYNSFEDYAPRCRMMQPRLYENLVKSEKYSGVLKPGAVKRLTKAVELLVQASPVRQIINPVTNTQQKFKLSFITLTVSETTRVISGKEAYNNLLAPFLQWIRRQHNCHLYIWKAELQARGQIHYHLTSDTFIHYLDIRKKWNELQRKHGYLDGYHARFKHWNANSTDVHSVHKVKNWAQYLKKEICKNIQNGTSLGGKVWDCSQNLKTQKYFTTICDNSYQDKLDTLVKEKKIRVLVTDHCRIYKMQNIPPVSLLEGADIREYNGMMLAIASKTAERVKPIRNLKENLWSTNGVEVKRIVKINVQTNLFSSS